MTFNEEVLQCIDEMRELFEAKNKQYATGSNPMANFVTGAALRLGRTPRPADVYQEAKAYQRKHIAHVHNHGIGGPKVDESLMDIAVYSLIQLAMVRRYRREELDYED